MYLSADYSNADQLVFCDVAGVPCELSSNVFEGVASFQGTELIQQFTEIHPDLVELAKEQVAAFVAVAEPAEDVPVVAEDVQPVVEDVTPVVEDVPPIVEVLDQSELDDAGVPESLLDEEEDH